MDETHRDEILRRMNRDQEARFRGLEVSRRQARGEALSADGLELMQQVRAIDQENTAWLRRLVREHGWPKRSEVGVQAADAAWLLVQHSDEAPEFQRECLEFLREAVEAGEASATSLAYLTDRVLCAEGKPQRYGTQFTPGPDGLQPQPIEDPMRVDEFRAGVGLGSLAEYAQQIRALHDQE
jgi:hypothetical protein